MDKTLVFAGNYNQYLAYCREHNVSPLRASYITSPEQIQGLRNPIVVRVGSYALREDASRIEHELRIASLR